MPLCGRGLVVCCHVTYRMPSGWRDLRRMQVRIMVKVIPQSFKYVSPNPEGGGNNRITEVQIR